MKVYSDAEIVALLIKAEEMGFDLEEGSDLERLTIADIDRLVNRPA